MSANNYVQILEKLNRQSKKYYVVGIRDMDTQARLLPAKRYFSLRRAIKYAQQFRTEYGLSIELNKRI